MPVPAGYPSAATTGVPQGTPLRVISGGFTITVPGTVISDVLITGCVTVHAEHVVIRDSKIVCGSRCAVLTVMPSNSGTTLSDLELDGEGSAPIGLDAKDVVAQRLNIYASGDGAHLGRGATLDNSYIHDLAHQSNLHHDDIQTMHGSTATGIVVDHDTLMADSKAFNGNSCYHLGSGSISDIQITDSYLDGGTFSIQVEDGPTQHDIDIRRNAFGLHFRFGIIAMTQHGSAVSFENNVYADGSGPATASNSRGRGTGATGSR